MSKEPKCPLFKKPCLEHGCTWYMSLLGADPQTGQSVKEWGCAITYMVVTNIETTQQTRQAGAAIESFRNEASRGQTALLAVTAQKLPPEPLDGELAGTKFINTLGPMDKVLQSQSDDITEWPLGDVL